MAGASPTLVRPTMLRQSQSSFLLGSPHRQRPPLERWAEDKCDRGGGGARPVLRVPEPARKGSVGRGPAQGGATSLLPYARLPAGLAGLKSGRGGPGRAWAAGFHTWCRSSLGVSPPQASPRSPAGLGTLQAGAASRAGGLRTRAARGGLACLRPRASPVPAPWPWTAVPGWQLVTC